MGPDFVLVGLSHARSARVLLPRALHRHPISAPPSLPLAPKTVGFAADQSSEMNVAFPKPGTDEQIEMPIPEQFVHTLQTDPKPHITSDVSDLYSH